jgi:colicin import membrane protein
MVSFNDVFAFAASKGDFAQHLSDAVIKFTAKPAVRDAIAEEDAEAARAAAAAREKEKEKEARARARAREAEEARAAATAKENRAREEAAVSTKKKKKRARESESARAAERQRHDSEATVDEAPVTVTAAARRPAAGKPGDSSRPTALAVAFASCTSHMATSLRVLHAGSATITSDPVLMPDARHSAAAPATASVPAPPPRQAGWTRVRLPASVCFDDSGSSVSI